MNRRFYSVLFAALLLVLGRSALASDIYFAPTAQGSGSGLTSCTNARALSSLVSGDFTPGVNFHLCSGTYGNTTSSATIDYNFYGNYACANGGDCFINQSGTFEGSFAAWKSYCSCDSHSLQNNSTLFSALGAPLSGAPNIEEGANLGSIAAGTLASLAFDTSEGNTRTPLARPASGTCSSQGSLPCWDIGAFQYQAATITTPAPAPNLFAWLSSEVASEVRQ